MCNSSLPRVRKEKTIKATRWGSRLVKGKEKATALESEREELHTEHPKDTCLDTGPYRRWEFNTSWQHESETYQRTYILNSQF